MIDRLRQRFVRHPRVSKRRLLASPQTMFGSTLVYEQEDERGDIVRFLSVKGMKESATYIDDRWCELVFPYTRFYDFIFATGLPVRRVLMVGGGGFSYPKHLIAHRPDASIDVAESDPAIIDLAEEFFFLDRLEREYHAQEQGRLRLICDDGRAVLERVATGLDALARSPREAELGSAAVSTECDGPFPRYDAILNDSFAAGVPAPGLATMEAARAVREALVPDGLYLTNVVSSLRGRESRFLQAQMTTLRQVFAHVHVVPCNASAPDALRENQMVIATDGLYRFPGERIVAPASDARVLTDANCPIDELIDW